MATQTTMAAKPDELCGKGLKEISCMADIMYVHEHE